MVFIICTPKNSAYIEQTTLLNMLRSIHLMKTVNIFNCCKTIIIPINITLQIKILYCKTFFAIALFFICFKLLFVGIRLSFLNFTNRFWSVLLNIKHNTSILTTPKIPNFLSGSGLYFSTNGDKDF